MKLEIFLIASAAIIIAAPVLLLAVVVLFELVSSLFHLIEIIFPINYTLVKWLLFLSFILYFIL
jgi:hypothetical protein